MFARIEVLELVRTIKYVRHKFLEKQSWRYADFAAQISCYGGGVQLKPEAALGNTLAAIVTFLLYGELQWFRHFPHI
jgi:hypothetical protein